MKSITHWLPAAFCAGISLIDLAASVASSKSGWGHPVFVAFLPMSFLLVGTVTIRMQRELRELRQRLTDLEQKKGS